MTKNWIFSAMGCLVLWLATPMAHGADLSFGILKNSPNKPLIVDIDNPNFRKLTVAIPQFLVRPGVKIPEAAGFATQGPTELSRLLTFSGLFNIMLDTGFKDVFGEVRNGYDKSMGKLEVNATGTATVGNINMVQWKSVGVEVLILGELFEENGNLGLNLHVYDITMAKELKGVQFSMITANYIPVLRRAGDIVLDLYTGKGGIFNSKLVFIGRKSKGSPKQVYVCDFDGTNMVQITNTNSIHLSPTWSPDGTSLVATSFELNNPDLYFYEIIKSKSGSIRPGMKKRIAYQFVLNSGGHFTPSGKLIAYTGAIEGNADIYTITPDGKNRVRLIGGHGLDVDPNFSPDGKYLAFVSGRYGNPHIFTATLKWQSDDKVTIEGDKRLTYAGWYNATPDWSPDSQKIAFAGYDKDINRWDLFVMNYDGTNMERLTLKIGDNESPSWSPNGQMIAFHTNRTGTSDTKDHARIYVMNRDGSAQRELPIDIYEAATPSWSKNVFSATD